MEKKAQAPIAVHALVAILALLVGLGLDYAANGLRQMASSTFEFIPSVIFRMALPIILALIFLGLVWYLYRYLPHPRRAGFVYLAAGLIGMLTFVSVFLPVLPFLQLPAVRAFRMWIAQLGFGSFHLISGFLFVLGIAASVRKDH